MLLLFVLFSYFKCLDKENGEPVKFYRPPNVAECIRCPDLAWLFIVGYLIAALLCAGLLLWLTQKREINFAGVRIAVDYFQVLSMFAGLKVAWPSQLSTMWRVAAAGKFSRKIVPNIKLDIHIHVFNTE